MTRINKNSFLILAILFLTAMFVISACNNETQIPENPSISSDTIKEGIYLVPEEIEPGFYKIILTDYDTGMGYFVRAGDLEFINILAASTITGDGYVEILETDTVINFFGIEIYPIEYSQLEINLKNEVPEGIYLIGIDLSPGIYSVEITDEEVGLAYVEISTSATMSPDDIIMNKLLSENGTITINEDDFAIKIEGGKLIKN